MNGRGIVGLVAALAVAASGCTSEVDAAGELRDIREVLAEAPEEADAEPDVGAGSPPTDEPPAGEHEGTASAEAPEAGEAPPDTSDVDVTVVPEEISVEYVQAVLDELERILAEALVLMMEEGELTLEITDRIGDIFTVEQRDARLSSLVELADSNFAGMRPASEIRRRDRVVQSVIEASPECIYVETLTSDDAFLLESGDATPVFVRLERPYVERPTEINRTPWVFASLGIGDSQALRSVRPCGA